jgi:hypothetical protein
MEAFVRQVKKTPQLSIVDPMLSIPLVDMMALQREDLDTWLRSSQITLFEQFQAKIYQWTKDSARFMRNVEHAHIHQDLQTAKQERASVAKMATNICMENMEILPDDVLRIIWQYADKETRIKYFIAKYGDQQRLSTRLQQLHFTILKQIYKKTIFCYQGLCMRRHVKRDRFTNPPLLSRSKSDLADEIAGILASTESLDFYHNPLCAGLHKECYVTLRISQLEQNPFILMDEHAIAFLFSAKMLNYEGQVFPSAFYEDRALVLWKLVCVIIKLYRI